MTKNILYMSLSALALTACKPAVMPDVSASSDNKKQGLFSISVDYMDQSVRPQDDFFQFSNGTWCKNNPVPDVESRWGSFNEVDKRNKEIL